MVELKVEMIALAAGAALGFNRSMVELKDVGGIEREGHKGGFNRSMVELKVMRIRVA